MKIVKVQENLLYAYAIREKFRAYGSVRIRNLWRRYGAAIILLIEKLFPRGIIHENSDLISSGVNRDPDVPFSSRWIITSRVHSSL